MLGQVVLRDGVLEENAPNWAKFFKETADLSLTYSVR